MNIFQICRLQVRLSTQVKNLILLTHSLIDMFRGDFFFGKDLLNCQAASTGTNTGLLDFRIGLGL